MEDRERMEASMRGQFAVKLKRVSTQPPSRNSIGDTNNNGSDSNSNNGNNSKEESGGDSSRDTNDVIVTGDKREKEFTSHMSKKQSSRKATKNSEGNRFINNGQL